MKLPNNYGSVTKLTGKRRKPWMVRICAGKEYNPKINGYELKRIVLGYYATQKEALAALAEYNNNPFNIQDASITFLQIYNRWKDANYPKLSKSACTSRDSALKHCSPLFDIKIKDVRYEMLQSILDACPHGTSTKKNIRTVMHTVFEYAMQNNLVSRDPSAFLKIAHEDPVIDREVFTDAELKKLWSMSDRWDVQIILILLYTGMRVNELLKNTKENCCLDEKYIYVPKELAKNNTSIRQVPLHDKIIPFIRQFYERSSGMLITNDAGTVVTYNNFATRNLKKINEVLGTTHKMHDTRHTFITNGHNCKLDDLTLQKIVGHSPDTITKKIYTHITLEQMLTEVNKIK